MNLSEAVEAEFRKEKAEIAKLTRHPVVLEEPEEGRFRIYCEATEVARFRLRRSLQCSGIVVPYGVVVNQAYRSRGIGQILERLRLNAAQEAGFGIALMTTRADNAAQIHIARKNGWQDAGIFTNPLTGHRVQLWIHNLQSYVTPPPPPVRRSYVWRGY